MQHVVDECVGVEGLGEHRPAARLHDGHGLVAGVFVHGGPLQIGKEVPTIDPREVASQIDN